MTAENILISIIGARLIEDYLTANRYIVRIRTGGGYHCILSEGSVKYLVPFEGGKKQVFWHTPRVDSPVVSLHTGFGEAQCKSVSRATIGKSAQGWHKDDVRAVKHTNKGLLGSITL